MKILIIGKGGREHALAWKIAQSNLVNSIFVAPGNDGIELIPHVKTIPIGENDHDGIINFIKKNDVNLTIIGPENVLLSGLANKLIKENLKVFGPTKEAAMIEGSKSFAKFLMKKYNIPTASFEVFDNYDSAINYVKNQEYPIVIKFDGLAAGKGVVISETFQEAENTLKKMMIDKQFGEGSVVVEEFLEGSEFSLMSLVNGETVVPFPVAQDHKRAYDGDTGPNTGGMGAYSPVNIIPQSEINKSVENIIIPMAKALKKEGCLFSGILYGGLILTKQGPKVIEFNARFGDPETEVVLPKIKSDLLQHILDLLEDKPFSIEFNEKYFLGVVLASENYPLGDTKNAIIKNLDSVTNLVFHMGTKYIDNQWKTNGGRVLFVLGTGNNLLEAKKDAYNAINLIKCDKLFFRIDIGYQSIK